VKMEGDGIQMNFLKINTIVNVTDSPTIWSNNIYE
jgi:hypothetical protein